LLDHSQADQCEANAASDSSTVQTNLATATGAAVGSDAVEIVSSFVNEIGVDMRGQQSRVSLVLDDVYTSEQADQEMEVGLTDSLLDNGDQLQPPPLLATSAVAAGDSREARVGRDSMSSISQTASKPHKRTKR